MGDHYHVDMPSPKSHQQHRDSPPYYLPESVYDNRRLTGTNTKMQVVTDSATAGRVCTSEGLLLLSLPQDRVALSETLCVVREVRFHSSFEPIFLVVLLHASSTNFITVFLRTLKSSQRHKTMLMLQLQEGSMLWWLARLACDAFTADIQLNVQIE
jgi:hypothetical protein